MLHDYTDDRQPTLFRDVERTPRIPVDITARKHRNSATSIAANPTSEAKREMHKKILAYMNFVGKTWLHDVCRAFDKKPNEISGRLSELKALELIEETGDREERCAVLKVCKR